MSPRLQFSLRQFIVVSGVIGILFALVGAELIRQRLASSRKGKIENLIDQHNVAVAAEGDKIFLVNANADSPLTGFLDEGERYIQFRGELSGQLDDVALDEIVTENQHIEILDLRDTLITTRGLASLVKLKKLHSLAVDARLCDEMGVQEISRLAGLQRLVIEGEIAAEHLEYLQNQLRECQLTTR